EHHVLEEWDDEVRIVAGAQRRTGDKAVPGLFEARLGAWVDQFPGRVNRSGVNLLERFNLFRSQAIGRVGALAEKDGRIKAAFARIVEDAVLDTIESIASCN